MKKIIKHYPMTDRLIVRGGYILCYRYLHFLCHVIIIKTNVLLHTGISAGSRFWLTCLGHLSLRVHDEGYCRNVVESKFNIYVFITHTLVHSITLFGVNAILK